MAVAPRTAAKLKLLQFLTAKGLRLTSQRQAIIDTVFSTDEHFTADQLLTWARRQDRTVSRATVYRTLPLLTESGLVREMDFGKDRKFYDPNYAEHPDHSHIICDECNLIVEFQSERLSKLESEISEQMGFAVKDQQLQIRGSCEEMRRLGACTKKPSDNHNH